MNKLKKYENINTNYLIFMVYLSKGGVKNVRK